MYELFARTLSQGLQAFVPIAVCVAWLRRDHQERSLTAVRWAVFAAIPSTAAAAWLFQTTAYQARWQSLLAIAAAGTAVACGSTIWRSRIQTHAGVVDRYPAAWQAALGGAAVLIIVRQTMEIAAAFGAAAIEMRSFDASMMVGNGAALAVVAAAGWVWFSNRLPRRALLHATRAFAVLFVVQIVFYAFHKSAEARFLPWGEMLDAATEPYGPDSMFGIYASGLLLLAPALVAGAAVVADLATVSATAMTLGGAFVFVCVVAALGAVGLPSAASRPAVTLGVSAPSHDVAPFLNVPHLLFRHTRRDADYGDVALAALDAPDAARATVTLSCARVSFGADRGICVQRRDSEAPGVVVAGSVQDAVNGGPTFNAVVFDRTLKPIGTAPLEGTPSRTRTSKDGRFGATTMFLGSASHGYGNVNVSTKTTLFDLHAVTAIADLEEFTAFRNGSPFKAVDFNYWGVTFSGVDSNTFYATLRTGTTNYLVRGNIQKRTVTVVAEDVECPSLSPDERWIAFKRRENPTLTSWKLHVLDLSTMEAKPITAASVYVDDQVEWLDSTHVLYALQHLGTVDIWMAPIDAAGGARLLVHDAESPIVVR